MLLTAEKKNEENNRNRWARFTVDVTILDTKVGLSNLFSYV